MDTKHETYNYTGNNWSHRNSNKRFKEKYGIPTTYNYTRNITHYRRYCSMKPEPRGDGDHCWFKRSMRKKKRPVTRDNNKIIIINISRLTKSALGMPSVITKTSYESLCNIYKVQLF